jgi:hypothetical protein
MTVYVDNMKAAFGNMTMCHMIADTDDELHEMAAKIGVQGKWHQAPPRHDSHYDIALSKRALAIKAGATQITWRQASLMCANRRATGTLGDPDTAEAVWKERRERRIQIVGSEAA